MGIFQKALILSYTLLFPVIQIIAGEIVEEVNRYGGKTELIIPEDTRFREYLKNYYDQDGFLVIQEEKLGKDFLAEIPYFLSRTYFFKRDSSLIMVERYIKPSEYTRLDQRYKDICWYKNDYLINSAEYYHKNDLFDYPHICKRIYKPDGSYKEIILNNDD